MSLKENYTGGLTCSLCVSDIDASIKWYQEVMQFELLYKADELGWCELKHPKVDINIGLSQVEKMPKVEGNTVAVWGVNDIEAAVAELKAKDVRFDGEIQVIPNMVKLASFFDPNDNCFMFYQDIS